MLNFRYVLPALAESPCCVAQEPASPLETVLAQSQGTRSTCCHIVDGTTVTIEILKPTPVAAAPGRVHRLPISCL